MPRIASAVACEPVSTTAARCRLRFQSASVTRSLPRCQAPAPTRRFCSTRCVGGSNSQTTKRPRPASGSRSVQVSRTSTSRAARASPTCSHASVGRIVTRREPCELLRMARVDDELEAAELGERADGPALHARDPLAVGTDGRRVDADADHGTTERARVRASSPAPRRVGRRRSERVSAPGAHPRAHPRRRSSRRRRAARAPAPRPSSRSAKRA